MEYNKDKKAAIDLSIGTVVIIVLAMSMLILGIILIRNIFVGATDSVQQIDQGVKNEINKLLKENNERVLILFPEAGLVKVKRGSRDSGFANSLKNTGSTLYTIDYRLGTMLKGTCTQIPNTMGIKVIGLTTTAESVTLDGERQLENPILVIFDIPESAELCTFEVPVEVTDGPTGPQTAKMKVEIVD